MLSKILSWIKILVVGKQQSGVVIEPVTTVQPANQPEPIPAVVIENNIVSEPKATKPPKVKKTPAPKKENASAEKPAKVAKPRAVKKSQGVDTASS